MTLYTLPKRYHPDFKDTRVKPIGEVELDTSHPLAKYVNSIIIKGTSLAVNTGSGDLSAKGGQQGFSSSSATTTTGWLFPKAEMVSDKSQYSIFVRFHQTDFTAGTNGRVLYTERPNATQIFKLAVLSGGIITATMRNAAGTGLRNRLPQASLDTSKEIHDIMFVRSSDTLRTIYGDDNSAIDVVSSGGVYNSSDVNLCHEPIDASIAANLTNVLIAYTFKKALSESEYNLLRRDPNALIKPKTPPVYFVSAATGISVTEELKNINYNSLNPVITLTGALSITESLVNTNYTALNPVVTLTGSISITEQLKNINYTSLDPIIDLTGLVDITENTVNTNYATLNPTITLTSAVIEITEQLVNTQYNTLNPSILLTPEPLGIVSTVCFDGVLINIEHNGTQNELSFNGKSINIAFNGNFNEIEFNGTIQTSCNPGSIKTNC